MNSNDASDNAFRDAAAGALAVILMLFLFSVASVWMVSFSIDTDAICRKVAGCARLSVTPAYSRVLQSFIWSLRLDMTTTGNREPARQILRQEFQNRWIPSLFSDQTQAMFVFVPAPAK
ncbi:MAG: hypothetical protein NT159_07420 [Proteobacteria bacterium]|nr:hypothetical protein [Pseudomonadota bacterium]